MLVDASCSCFSTQSTSASRNRSSLEFSKITLCHRRQACPLPSLEVTSHCTSPTGKGSVTANRVFLVIHRPVLFPAHIHIWGQFLGHQNATSIRPQCRLHRYPPSSRVQGHNFSPEAAISSAFPVTCYLHLYLFPVPVCWLVSSAFPVTCYLHLYLFPVPVCLSQLSFRKP